MSSSAIAPQIGRVAVRHRLLTRIISSLARVLAPRYALVVLFVAFLPVAIRLALLPVLPVPASSINDEFSNLLAADTFLHGRLSNPTPPAWEHFETIHVLLQPTYSSKYPPGIGILLALSKILFGDPWYGVLLSVAGMSLATMWMLRAWFPPLWTLLAGLLVGLQFGIVHYWANGYWGGTLTGIGGSLLVGAYGRLRRSLTAPSALAYAAGIALLICTRPYEGGVLTLTVSCALLWNLRATHRVWPGFAYLSLASVVFVLPVLFLMAAQNKAVTGSMLVLPHDLYYKEYEIMPSLVWQPRQTHTYRHAALRDYFYHWEPESESAQEWGTLRGIIPVLYGRLQASGQFVPHAIYFPVALLSLIASLFKKMRFFGICVLTALLANALVNWLTAHYLAPVLGAMIGIHVYFLRYLRVLHRSRGFGQYAFVAAIVLLAVCFGIRFYTKIGIPGDKVWAYQRRAIDEKLSDSRQRHLIFVRYGPSHDATHEWVYNSADIPSQKVIWARYMSPDSDRRAAAMFGNRMRWILEPDRDVVLRPYPELSAGH